MKIARFLVYVALLASCFAGAIKALYAEPTGLQVVSGSAEFASPSETGLIGKGGAVGCGGFSGQQAGFRR